jgi:serine protease Do
MARDKRLYFGTTMVFAVVAVVVAAALSVQPKALGDRVAPLWTEKSDGAMIDPRGPDGFTKLAKDASPAVVNITTSKTMKSPFGGRKKGRKFGANPFHEFFERFFGEMPRKFKNRGLGTGFVIHPKGYLLTNNHVVEDADEIKVKFADDRELSAKVVGSDPKTDVALLKVETKDDLPVVPLGDSDKLDVGAWVVAIGNPFGLGHTVTQGIVSAKGRRGIAPSGRDLPYADFIQTDASINPGNSGGPLLNLKGEVIGINTAINAAGQGIGFAIPVNMVKVLVPQLKSRGRVVRSWLGIHIQPVSRELARSFGLSEPRGALVAEVVPGAPAAKAGLQPGDVVMSFNGHSIRRHNDLPWLASTAGVGTQASLKVMREGKELDLTLTLSEHPGDGSAVGQNDSGTPGDGQGGKALGMRVSNVTPDLQQELGLDRPNGAVVREVSPDSEAAQAGVQAKDVIVKVNFKPVRNAADFERVVSSLKSGDPVNFYLRRDKSYLWVAFLKK